MNCDNLPVNVPGFNQEEADDFLDKVNDVNKQIQDLISGKTDVEELNKKEAEMLEKQRLKEVAKQIKEKEAHDKYMKGRQGKGHKFDYKTFCKGCFREFVMDGVDVCTVCGMKTMTVEERKEELMSKLGDYKDKTALKKTRRAKWENWRKTQEMFYKKTSTNYHKWDMFESSEEEVETEPIVPKDDPNFQAMEKDFEERAARRRKDKAIAEREKAKGNECFKRGLYKTANKHYTEAIEHKKDYLQCYTNRAISRIKMEHYQDALDDCTRVLEYCDVFDNCYTKQADVCYKAFIRRAMANRGLKDFNEAINDCKEAAKIFPEEKDPAKLIEQYESDREHDQRILKIMANAESLKGKEFLDFLLDYLKGHSHAPELKPGVRLPDHCKNELKGEEATKLMNIIESDEELMYYFNAKDGFKALTDSLHFNYEALPLLDKLLQSHQKLREDYQRQHQYEALIDFIYRRNVKVEGATLPSEVVFQIMTLLESASLNEVVRANLSDKHKIKDLFLVVIRSIEVAENMKLVSALVQFISNLCYGQGKFRQKLASEPPADFLQTIADVLKVVENSLVNDQDKSKTDWEKEKQRSVLKHSVINFIVNLCNDAKLRAHIASNMGGVLASCFKMLQVDSERLDYDWLDSVPRELAVFINSCLDPNALKYVCENGIVKICERLLQQLKIKEESHRECLARVMNLIAKATKVEESCKEICQSKQIIVCTLFYFCQNDHDDLAKQCLLTFHQCCKQPDFKEIVQDQLKFTDKTFDGYVKFSSQRYERFIKAEDWPNYVNICASITAFCNVFPHRMESYQDIIPGLVTIVSSKTDQVRKSAAVLLAKLATNEENAKVMRKHHGTEVLLSLRNQLQ